MRKTFVTIVAILTVACASLTVKQKAHLARMTVHEALVAVRTYEVDVLCKPKAEAVNTCTQEPRLITDEQHQNFHRGMVVALNLDIRAGNAIVEWKAGMPYPTEIGMLQDYATQLFAVANALAPSEQTTKFIQYAQSLLDAVADLRDAFSKKFEASVLPILSPIPAGGFEWIQ